MPEKKPITGVEITNRQCYVKYGRKNGLRALKILIEYLSGDALNAAKDAYNYLESCYYKDSVKFRGRYK